ncbi:MAG: type VI secretion system transmembrane protein TssO [Flavobacteriaceae bacterium]|nr:type VI secretion system transmembrane protein TssO [Flavobacteriaceae bacterium]
MKLQNLSEMFWKGTKFFLLFVICMTTVYIVLTKFVFQIPETNHQQLLSSIEEFELVLEQQKTVHVDFNKIAEDVQKMEFQIHQVQKKDELKREISKIRSLYIHNQKNSKYKFTLNAADLLLFYFHSREKHSSMISNRKNLETNLNECQANL